LIFTQTDCQQDDKIPDRQWKALPELQLFLIYSHMKYTVVRVTTINHTVNF
jgi:hypothetical protein